MNIFHKVTLQSLKKNKTRTIVTIIGIMLSASMICAVTTFVSSFQNYMLENAVYENGDWHGAAQDAALKICENIQSSEEVEHSVYAEQIGYAIAEGCTNEDKPYLYILGASKGFEDTMPIHITSGKYPASADEILLPNHLFDNGDVEHSIGDVLTLEIGDRISGGAALGQNNPFEVPDEPGGIAEPEELVIRETRTYTVVGFYERPGFEDFSSPGYTAITVADEKPSDSYLYSLWFKMNNAEDVYAFMEKMHVEPGTTNRGVLSYSGVFRFDNYGTMLAGLMAIVIGLIMFGSIALIYNAFSISVSERTKQFGLLSSVGATKKQLKKMVLFEAFAVSAVGIPLGILVGIGGISVTLLLIGSKFSSLIGYEIPLKVCVSFISVGIAVLVALVTVLISAWIPSKRATRISAVEAIRQNLDIHAKGRRVKTSKLTYKLFGLPGMLANKHYKRSRKKYRTTIVSLFMSIVLFVSATAFTDYLTESVEGGFATVPYDIGYYCNMADTEQMQKDDLLKLFENADSVTNAAYAWNYMATGTIDRNALSRQALDNLADSFAYQPGDINPDRAAISVYMTFVNDSEFKKLLKENGLDEKTYMNPDEPLALLINNMTFFSDVEKKYISTDIFKLDANEITLSIRKEMEGYYFYDYAEDKDGNQLARYASDDNSDEFLNIPYEEAYDAVIVNTGKAIDKLPYYCYYGSGLTLIYPHSLLSSVFSNQDMDSSYRYFMQSDNHEKSYQAVKQIVTEHKLSNGTGDVYDYAERADDNRNIIVIIQVFAYGFIVLISLIAAANVFNTISTNISLRRREFAMLKSVGMTAKGFNKMMNFECLLYGTRALLYGLPVAAGVTYLIYRSVSEGYETAFHLPWTAIGIAVLSVFAVVFATMMYSMSKVKKDNPIDTLKNENL